MTTTVLVAAVFLVHSLAFAYPPIAPRELRCNDDSDARTGSCQLAWNLVGSERSTFQVEIWGKGSIEWTPVGTVYIENYHVTEISYRGGAFYRVVACDTYGRACRPSRVTYVFERPDEEEIPAFVMIRDASGAPNRHSIPEYLDLESRLRLRNVLRTAEIISEIGDLSAWGEMTAPRDWDEDRFEIRPADLTEHENSQWDIYSGYLTAISGRTRYRARLEREEAGASSSDEGEI